MCHLCPLVAAYTIDDLNKQTTVYSVLKGSSTYFKCQGVLTALSLLWLHRKQ